MKLNTDNPEHVRRLVNERFIRWQKIAIDQLGYAVNLIFLLAVAALGYFFQLVRDQNFIPGSTARHSMLFSVIGLALSAIAGLCCVITRLIGFRKTAARARGKLNTPSQDELDRLSKTVWLLFWIQAVAFAMGILGLTISLLLTYGEKLL